MKEASLHTRGHKNPVTALKPLLKDARNIDRILCPTNKGLAFVLLSHLISLPVVVWSP